MHFNIYYLLYSQIYHQRVSAATAAIFRVIILKEYKVTNVVSYYNICKVIYSLYSQHVSAATAAIFRV
jgi:hypothetical protein